MNLLITYVPTFVFQVKMTKTNANEPRQDYEKTKSEKLMTNKQDNDYVAKVPFIIPLFIPFVIPFMKRKK